MIKFINPAGGGYGKDNQGELLEGQPLEFRTQGRTGSDRSDESV